jgi:hypothetical protein
MLEQKTAPKSAAAAIALARQFLDLAVGSIFNDAPLSTLLLERMFAVVTDAFAAGRASGLRVVLTSRHFVFCVPTC